jgi:hypothetical protein
MCLASSSNFLYRWDARYLYKKSLLLGMNPVSSVSNGLYFLTLPLVSVTRVISTSKGMSKRSRMLKKFGVRVIYRKIRCIYIGLLVRYLLFLSDFIEMWIFLTDFWKLLRYQMLRKSVSGGWVVPCTWPHRQTDMMMLMSLFALLPTCLTTAHTKIVSQHEFRFH